MLVATHMTAKPVTITPADNLGTAEQKMRAGEFRRLPVVDGNRLVGILSDRDLLPHSGYLKETRVTGAMTEKPVTVTPKTTLEEAAQQMLDRKIDSLPVVDDGNLVGIVTTTDVLRAFLELSGSPARAKRGFRTTSAR